MKKKKKQKYTRTQKKFPDIDIVETKDFSGVIEEVEVEGRKKKRMKILSQRWYQHNINKFKVGEKVSMYISNKKPKRSLAQNRFLFGVYYPLVAHETGQRNIEAMHRGFAEMFLCQAEEVVYGRRVYVVKSSASLSKSEFSAFITDIEAETGIEAPPTELRDGK